MTRASQDISAQEPDSGNLHVRSREGSGPGGRSGRVDKILAFSALAAGILAGIAGCSIPSSLIVWNATPTYSCECHYSLCQSPDSSGGCSGSETILGAAPTLLCDSTTNAAADCSNVCGGLAGELSGGGLPGLVATPTGAATLIQANSCNPGGGSVALIGQGVNSFVVSVDSTNSTLQVADSSTGSGGTAHVSGTLSYTLNGTGGMTLNLESLRATPFVVDGVVISNLTIVGQAPASGTFSGTAFIFPAGSVTATVSGASTAVQLAELTNDTDLTGTFDPATDSFTLTGGIFYSSDYVTGTTFVATLSLNGTYQQGPPTAVAGGPYDTTTCSVQLDGSRSTDYNGATSGLVYQWFEGQTLLGAGPGAQQAVTLLSPGTNAITLRVINSSGEFSEAPTTATTTATAAACGAAAMADLALTKTGPAYAVLGSQLPYTLTVTNNGPVNAANVAVTDTLPAGTSFVSCTASDGASCIASGNTVSASLGTVTNGNNVTLSLTTAINSSIAAGTVVTNTASVASATPDPNAANNSASASVTAIYNICVLYDQTKTVHSGAVIPIRLYLCDASGNDLSGSSIVVHATGVTQVSTSASGTLEDAGNSNPDSDFRYDSTLGPSGGYIFNLSTAGMSGTYDLNFTAGADPTTHNVLFGVQ